MASPTPRQSQSTLYDPSRLRAALVAALRGDPANRHSPTDDTIGVHAQQLFEELILSKQQLIRLFEVGPRSEAERKEVEGGEHPRFLRASFLLTSGFYRACRFAFCFANLREDNRQQPAPCHQHRFRSPSGLRLVAAGRV